MHLILFNDTESELVYQCLYCIKKNNKHDEVERIEKNINALLELIQAISFYPSILKSDSLSNKSRSVDTLMEVLRHNEGLDKIMYTPIKAVLGKSFLLAKLSFFKMMIIIAGEVPELQSKVNDLTNCATDVIFTLMVEEVYLCIVEDDDSDDLVRNRAGFLLANIWEYQLMEGVNDFAPILNEMWTARKKLIPIFGTMLGTMEIMQISQNVGPLWIEFIQHEDNPDEVFQAVEEFLFTLSYEELCLLRKEMKDKDLNSVSREKVEVLIGKSKLYADFDEADNREMYRFFRSRKINALFRKRAHMPGPKKTLEEHIMCYLLSSNKWIPH